MFLYLMGVDDVNLGKVLVDAFVVYQRQHGDHSANVILFVAAYGEKGGTYENTK